MSVKKVKVHINGHSYTFHEASQVFGISEHTIRQRYYNYQVGENLVRPVNRIKAHVPNGQAATMKRLSYQYHIKLATLYSRYYAGKRGRELILKPHRSHKPKSTDILPPNKRHPQRVYVNGELRSFRSLSRESHISCTALRKRFERGDRDDDLIRPLGDKLRKSRRPMHLTVLGESWTFRQLGDRYGLPVSTIQDRYYQGQRDTELIQPLKRHAH